MAPIDREEFRDSVALIRADIQGLGERMSEVQTGHALLKQRVDVIEKKSSTSSRWWERVSGSAAAAAVALVLEYLAKHLK